MQAKLLSAKGTLLGAITYPDSWEPSLQRNGGIVVRCYTPLRVYMGEDEPAPATTKTFTLHKSHSRAFPGALLLQGLTPEEFEAEPGCSFSPSAAYLRSILS